VGLKAGLDVSEKSVLPPPGFEPRIVHDKKETFQHISNAFVFSCAEFAIRTPVPKWS